MNSECTAWVLCASTLTGVYINRLALNIVVDTCTQRRSRSWRGRSGGIVQHATVVERTVEFEANMEFILMVRTLNLLSVHSP
jgi:hypothetical protein